MFPILLKLGPFVLPTIAVFSTLALILGSFLFWRKSREEHYTEHEALDVFLQSIFWGVLAGRVGYVLVNISAFGMSVWNWFNILDYPGIHGGVTLLVSTLLLSWLGKKHKWDVFEVLDFWAIAMSAMTAVMYIGLFFDGTVFGNETNLFFGVQFPGLYTKHHPTQLYWATAFIFLSWYLSKLEYRYRTFEWYRGGRNTAQTGFLFSVSLIITGIVGNILSIFQPPFLVPNMLIERILYLGLIIVGAFCLWMRSGKSVGIMQRSNQ